VALFDVAGVQQRLEAGTGGYEIVHGSPGLEIGVYVLVAPEPDHQSPHEDDEVYVVLEGSGSRTSGSRSRRGKRSSSRPAPGTASPATRA